MKITLYGRYIIGEHYYTDGTTGKKWSLTKTEECPDEFVFTVPDGSTQPKFGTLPHFGIDNVVWFSIYDDFITPRAKNWRKVCVLTDGYMSTDVSWPEFIIPHWGNLPDIAVMLHVDTVNGAPAYFKHEYEHANANSIVPVPADNTIEAIVCDRYGVPTSLGRFSTYAEAVAAIVAYRGEKMP